MLSKAEEGMDFFCDGTMFISGTIYVTQQNRLRERSGLKLMSSHEILVAPESKRAEVLTEVRDVRDFSST